jgi:lipopolysaccharide exporter
VTDSRRTALGGIAWNYVSSGATLLAQVGYTAATARLLSPSAFGAYAAAQALAGLSAYFTLTTLGNAAVRKPERTRDLFGTALWLSGGAAAVSGVAVFALASPWSQAWHAPAATPLIRVIAIAGSLTAFSAVPLAFVRGALRYRAAALLEAASQIVGMVIGLATALALRSAMALALSQVASALILLLGAFWLAGRPASLRPTRRRARELMSFAGQISGQNLVYYAIYTAPTWAISRIFGTAALGFYSRANLVVGLPANHLSVGITKTLYPLYRRRDDLVSARELIEFTLQSVTAVVWPLFAAAAGAAPLIVGLLLGPKWHEAVALIPPMALFFAVNVAFVVVGNPIEVLGHLALAWRLQALWACLVGAAVAVALTTSLSLAGLLYVLAAAEVCVHIVQVFAAGRRSFVRPAVVARGYGRTSLASLAFLAVPVGIGFLLTEHVALQAVADLLLLAALAVAMVRWTGIADDLRSVVSGNLRSRQSARMRDSAFERAIPAASVLPTGEAS